MKIMSYYKVKWLHEPKEESEPVWIYMELDGDRSEVRKVHIFVNGECECADETRTTKNTQLSVTRIPSLEAIAEDLHFVPSEIEKVEFEDVWTRATKSNSL